MHRTFGYICILVMVVTSFAASSCHDDNDIIGMSSSLDEASSSFEGQFRTIWTALDMNYQIWDYEKAKYGLDWDEVYNEYLPKFKELDLQCQSADTIADSVIWSLYEEVIGQLHDGHTTLYLTNVTTGKRITSKAYVVMNPSRIRHQKDSLFLSAILFSPSLDYYKNKAEGDDSLIEAESAYYRGMWLRYGLFKDYVAYLGLNSFFLSQVFENEGKSERAKDFEHVWKLWFSRIQELNGKRMLKGIIIDVRSNEGGSSGDYKYTLGALHNQEAHQDTIHLGYERYKSGVGRFDYSVLFPMTLQLYPKEHESISVPIVVLSNVASGSMAEIACLAAKKLRNARVIGTRTWGGFSGVADANDKVDVYRGNIGDSKLSDVSKPPYACSFYLHVPAYAYHNENKEIIEGEGVEPDIEVGFDENLYKEQSRDSQLERALEYIRTGK